MHVYVCVHVLLMRACSCQGVEVACLNVYIFSVVDFALINMIMAEV